MIEGYRVYRSTDATTYELIAELDATQTSYTDTETEWLATYRYAVAAFNPAEGPRAHICVRSLVPLVGCYL